jgi:ATP-binding cassette subfamily C (CFTR/MRP) protein 1
MLGSLKAVRSSGMTTKLSELIDILRQEEIRAAKGFWLLGVYTSTLGM